MKSVNSWELIIVDSLSWLTEDTTPCPITIKTGATMDINIFFKEEIIKWLDLNTEAVYRPKRQKPTKTEFLFIEFMKNKRIGLIYEPFRLKVGFIDHFRRKATYLPDFYCPKEDKFYEVSSSADKTKITPPDATPPPQISE